MIDRKPIPPTARAKLVHIRAIERICRMLGHRDEMTIVRRDGSRVLACAVCSSPADRRPPEEGS